MSARILSVVVSADVGFRGLVWISLWSPGKEGMNSKIHRVKKDLNKQKPYLVATGPSQDLELSLGKC